MHAKEHSNTTDFCFCFSFYLTVVRVWCHSLYVLSLSKTNHSLIEWVSNQHACERVSLYCLSDEVCMCQDWCVCLFVLLCTPLLMWHFASHILLTYILSLKSCVHCMFFCILHTHLPFLKSFHFIPLFGNEYVAINLASHSLSLYPFLSISLFLPYFYSISHQSRIFHFTHLSS